VLNQIEKDMTLNILRNVYIFISNMTLRLHIIYPF